MTSPEIPCYQTDNPARKTVSSMYWYTHGNIKSGVITSVVQAVSSLYSIVALSTLMQSVNEESYD